MTADRIFIFKDDKIHALVVEKGRLVGEGRVIATEMAEMQKKLNLLEVRVQKVKDKIIPAIVKKTKDELKEFEIYTSSDIKDGMVVVTIVDALEQFKTEYKKSNKK